jgi:DNA-binding transcriptional MerR regulator
VSDADEAAEARRSSKSASAFRTIGEVAEDLDLPTHVLRFWETKFPQLKPLKRGGGRRYYRPEDVDLLRRIRQCLYQDGYTIRGVQKLLGDEGEMDAPPGAFAVSVETGGAETMLFPLDPVPARPAPKPMRAAARRVAPNPEPTPMPAPEGLSADARAGLEEIRRELLEIRALIAQLADPGAV